MLFRSLQMVQLTWKLQCTSEYFHLSVDELFGGEGIPVGATQSRSQTLRVRGQFSAIS